MRIVKAIKKLLLSNKKDSNDSKEIEPNVDEDNIEQESSSSSIEHETKVSDDFIIVTDIPDVNDYKFNLNISDEEKNSVTNECHNYANPIEQYAKFYSIDSSIKIIEIECGIFKLTFKKKGVSLYEVYNDLVNKYGYSIFGGCILSIEDKQFYIQENTIPQIYEVIKISNNRMLYKLGTTIYYTIVNRLANNKLTYKYAHLDITASYYRLYKSKNKYEVYNSDLILVKEKEDLNYEGEGYLDEGRRVHIGAGKIKTDKDEFSILGNYRTVLNSETLKTVNGIKNPAKLILLITVINLMVDNVYEKNKILFSNSLKDSFEETWCKYFDISYVLEDEYLPNAIQEMEKETFWSSVFCDPLYDDNLDSLSLDTYDELKRIVRNAKFNLAFYRDLVRDTAIAGITLRFLDSIMKSEVWEIKRDF